MYSRLLRREQRTCARDACENVFETQLADPKQFCSQSCRTTVHNVKRGPRSEATKRKISESVSRVQKMYAQIRIKQPVLVDKFGRSFKLVKSCLRCAISFETARWQNHKYCSVQCAMKDIGSRPTSPRAARGKSGIRPDISPSINFYSRWEANFARAMNFLEVDWMFQPKRFDIGGQMYTPDFFLPEFDVWIEIKNFLSDYSRQRDDKFHLTHPAEALIMILKDDYLRLEKSYASHIPLWER